IDGKRQTPEQRELSITASKNGPYFVQGAIDLSADGARPPWPDRYALCRCGGSKNKPFCDGTHWSIEFDGSRGRQKGVLVPPLGVKRFAIAAGTLLVGGTAVALIAIGRQDLPGFLGPGGLIPDLNLVLEFLL